MAGTRSAAAHSIGSDHKQDMIFPSAAGRAAKILLITLMGAAVCSAEGMRRDFVAAAGSTIEVVNLSGRVEVNARENSQAEADSVAQATLSAEADRIIADSEIKFTNVAGRTRIEVLPSGPSKRIDLSISVPERVNLKIKTGEGEVRISGNIESADVTTGTGTIAVDVPTESIKYQLTWNMSRPRFLSDFELEKVKEKSGGRFELKGTYSPPVEENSVKEPLPLGEAADELVASDEPKGKKKKTPKSRVDGSSVALNFTTDRGIVLLNVPPNEVSSDLRERPLTEAAKAIIRSGDSILMDAIRRASPKYFGDYTRTLPPMRREPVLGTRTETAEANGNLKRASVRVTDKYNRSIPGLKAEDFEVAENGVEREIVKVDTTTAPFNLVLLLDVSGSVDNYVDFIRKAARNFVNTVGRNDRVSIVLFYDDVNVLCNLPSDKAKRS